MAPFSNEWLSKAWNGYTSDEPPWIFIKQVAIGVVGAPLLAVFLGFADLIETWTNALVIEPLLGVVGFGVELANNIFYGYEISAISSIGDLLDAVNNLQNRPTTGLVGALDNSFSGLVGLVSDLGLAGLPVALGVVLLLAYALGRWISRG